MPCFQLYDDLSNHHATQHGQTVEKTPSNALGKRNAEKASSVGPRLDCSGCARTGPNHSRHPGHLISWVDTRKAIAATEAEWLAEKEIVADLITLLESEKAKLEKDRGTRRFVGRHRRATCRAQCEPRKAPRDDGGAERSRSGIRDRGERLIEKLPAPLVSELSQLITRLPDPDSETRLALSQRLLTVVGILNKDR